VNEPFIPTVDNPGRVAFSEDGSHWVCTRDEFIQWSNGGGLQMLVTILRPAGSVLEPATKYVDEPSPLKLERSP
jgi:hypothetical protein